MRLPFTFQSNLRLTCCIGGRFREQYYWDSFWIVEGLLESELYDIVNATLHNFMDELEHIGFIPNGGRIYYLNRSQPPLFVQVRNSTRVSLPNSAHPRIRCSRDMWKRPTKLRSSSGRYRLQRCV